MLDRMLAALARGTTTYARRTLVVALLLTVVAGVLGAGVVDRLGTEGFDDPRAESSRAREVLAEQFGTGSPSVVMVLTAAREAAGGGAAVDDPAVAAAGLALTERLAADPELQDVASYWSLGAPPALRSQDGTRALLVARGVAGDVETGEHVREVYAETVTDADGPVLEVLVGGAAGTFAELQGTIETDLARAESIAIPVTIALLVLAFGSLVAAGLPLLLGLVSIVGATGVLFALTHLTDVSVFSLNLTIALGLGLGIDYSLFIVSRYREELGRGLPTKEAIDAAMRSAGRTVVFSGVTVAIALGALLVFPLYFLRSFAYAGVAVVLLSLIGALVVLPAVLALLGHRVERGRVLGRRPERQDGGAWFGIAQRVMRRPWPVAIGVTGLLVVLGLPFLQVAWGNADERTLPASADAHQAGQILRAEFAGRESDVLSVALPEAPSSSVAAYAEAVSRLDGVVRVESVAGVFADGALVAQDPGAIATHAADTGAWLTVVPDAGPYTAEGDRLVAELRAVPAPGEALVAGSLAAAVDTKDAMASALPWALAIIALGTGVLLFLFTGSVVLPVKALLLTTLSLSATFGAMVWVFQQGHLADVLGFTPMGTLEMGVPVLMFCVAFGLSMDYEVFLLSRIKEEHDAHGDNTLAVARGLQRTGSIITAAAALLAIVFIAFASSGVSTVKLLGLGVALAVLIDATLVRALLVPAVMRLAGEWNWWAPAPLRRLYARVGVSEHGATAGAAGVAQPTAASVPDARVPAVQ